MTTTATLIWVYPDPETNREIQFFQRIQAPIPRRSEHVVFGNHTYMVNDVVWFPDQNGIKIKVFLVPL